ncbi:MAG: hypothetical protein IKF72_04895 [Kiritimatiellae bacterium]|nr:hypothetical protein [Kiritimatiellia bacterium]
MLAGFAAALLIGDMFLAVRGAATTSVEFLYGVAGFSLAQVFWTIGQLREARPDVRVLLAAALPLAAFVICRLHPPVLPAAANAAVCVYSVLTALSFATALATRRAFYICGIGFLLFSDLMIGGGLVHMPGCNALIGPTYIAAELFLLVSFFWNGEWRIALGQIGIRWYALTLGAAGFACFFVAMTLYPGGGYNPLMQMLSALGRTEVRGVAYPPCHYWFVAGMFLSVASVAGVWARLVRKTGGGWRRAFAGWGGAVNVAGLCSIALVPENVDITIHNVGCYLATFGGAAILVARFRKGVDLFWTIWFVVLVIVFALCLDLKAVPFSPYVTTTQKFLIVSFAVWSGWLAWRIGCKTVEVRSIGKVANEDREANGAILHRRSPCCR